MSTQPRIVLAQIPVRLGDLQANLDSIRHSIETSASTAGLLVFPALALTGHAFQKP